jgi:L-threonylcarbamoyladenylate synthase
MDRPDGVDARQLEHAVDVLHRGGLVAFPTETVYGLGALVEHPSAVAAIFDVKGRPRFDPLIVHLADVRQVEPLVADFPPVARALAEHFWPGPLTLVLPKHPAVPDLVTAGLPTVAVRVPSHPMALALLQRTGRPIAAPSANRFGRISPTTAAHVRDELGDAVDVILDGGPCSVGIESTIVVCGQEHVTLLRPGGCPREAIERVIGTLQLPQQRVTVPLAPGMLPQHYAPHTPLILTTDAPPPGTAHVAGLLCLQPPPSPDAYAAVEVLSATGDLREAAVNLFAALRRLDGRGLAVIIAQPMPNHGLGLAINDRLLRASHQPGVAPTEGTHVHA